MVHSPQFLKLVDDAKKRVKETNVPELKKRVDGGEKLILIDVREDSEWARGHLPGAVHMGRGVIERDIEQQIPDTATNSFYIAEEDSGLRWLRTICKKWGTPTSSRWMAAGAVGSQQVFRQ